VAGTLAFYAALPKSKTSCTLPAGLAKFATSREIACQHNRFAHFQTALEVSRVFSQIVYVFKAGGKGVTNGVGICVYHNTDQRLLPSIRCEIATSGGPVQVQAGEKGEDVADFSALGGVLTIGFALLKMSDDIEAPVIDACPVE
jgi:hypothetical protein